MGCGASKDEATPNIEEMTGADEEDLVEAPFGKKKDEVGFVTGIAGEVLFKLPKKTHDTVKAKYRAVVGEDPTGLLYLNLLMHVGYARGISKDDPITGSAHGKVGFGMRALNWTHGPDTPQ